MHKPKLTYASVVSTLALFIALGGVGYAAVKLAPNSVGSKQLKRAAVSAAKIKNGAVTGAKIKLSTLGNVPHAARADSAASADSATSAKTATIAASAEHADGLAPAEAAHVVGAAGESPFNTGWASAPTPAPPLAFYKDHEGIVHLEGDAGRVSGAQVTIFTLPAGYAPAVDEVFPVLAGGALASIDVSAGGGVQLLVGNAGHVALNSVTWRAR